MKNMKNINGMSCLLFILITGLPSLALPPLTDNDSLKNLTEIFPGLAVCLLETTYIDDTGILKMQHTYTVLLFYFGPYSNFYGDHRQNAGHIQTFWKGHTQF